MKNYGMSVMSIKGHPHMPPSVKLSP